MTSLRTGARPAYVRRNPSTYIPRFHHLFSSVPRMSYKLFKLPNLLVLLLARTRKSCLVKNTRAESSARERGVGTGRLLSLHSSYFTRVGTLTILVVSASIVTTSVLRAIDHEQL